MDKLYEQCIELPRAISTSDGEPNTGTKAVATTVHEKRYEDATPSVFSTGFPTGWIPSTVIMERMFLINTAPWDAQTRQWYHNVMMVVLMVMLMLILSCHAMLRSLTHEYGCMH